jgi:ELWxxDGT repeat protein
MTKNLLLPAIIATLRKAIFLHHSKILLCLLCICSISGFAQKEKLIRKGLFLDNLYEFTDAISLANQKIIFSAFDNDTHSPSGSSSLWISDGTATGTKILKNFGDDPDINFFNNITLSTRFFSFNNKVFFNAANHLDDSINYLYVTDGTENGTFRLISEKVASSVYAIYNEKLYIGNNNELLSSDGTKAGTQRVAISPSLEIINLFTLNQQLIVETVTGLYAYNDQIRAFTFLADKSNPAVATKGFVFFIGKDGDLWKTNGTTTGTSSVINITDGADVRAPNRLIATNKYVAFLSYTDKTKNSNCLWFSDGNTTVPMKDDKGKIVSTDTTGFIPLPTKFEEKLYFYLYNLDDITLASNNYLYVFNNYTSNAKFLDNITGFEGNLYPFTPKVNNTQEYLFGTPEGRFLGDGDITIKGFKASIDVMQTWTRIKTETQKSWVKSGGKIYFNKSNSDVASGLYTQTACGFDTSIETPDGTHICGENPIRLNTKTTIYGTPHAVYNSRWEHKNEPSKNGFYDAYTAGIYIVNVSDGLCTITDSIKITKSDSLLVSIKGKVSFCPGESITLTAIPEAGVAPYTYQWKNSITNIGLNIDTLSVNTVGNYNVFVKDSKGCQGTAPLYAITQKPLPDVRINKSDGTDIVSGSSTTLSVSASANQTYQWFKDATSISGATKNNYTAIEAGKYSVTVNVNGCSASSEIVIVNLILSNEAIKESILIEVFPNPTENLIKLNIIEPLKKAAQISLINTHGIVIKRWEIKQQDNILNLSDMPAGEYILKANINNQSTAKKIIKLH